MCTVAISVTSATSNVLSNVRHHALSFGVPKGQRVSSASNPSSSSWSLLGTASSNPLKAGAPATSDGSNSNPRNGDNGVIGGVASPTPPATGVTKPCAPVPPGVVLRVAARDAPTPASPPPSKPESDDGVTDPGPRPGVPKPSKPVGDPDGSGVIASARANPDAAAADTPAGVSIKSPIV